MSYTKNLAGAIGLMAIGMICIPVGDGIAKHIQAITEYQPVMVSWARFTLPALLLLPYVIVSRQLPAPTVANRFFWWQQTIRGVTIAATVTFIVTAVGLSPIADVFGAFFIGPGISVILAQWLLGVRANRTDWLAVALGFLGVLFVVQPTGEVSPGIPWALASGCCYGAFLVATRWAAKSGPATGQLAAQFAIAAIFLTPFGLPQLLQHGLQVPALLVATALLSGSANWLAIAAFAKVGNAVLAPVIYLQVVAATVVGVVMFNAIPNALTAIGLSLIIAAGAFQAVCHWRAKPVDP